MLHWLLLSFWLFGQTQDPYINTGGQTIVTRLIPPAGYIRPVTTNFGNYLRAFPLKAHGSSVKTYKGELSALNPYSKAVLDLPLEKQDLLQCADALMYLRAAYLRSNKQEDKIAFHFVSGLLCDYASYKQGYRYTQQGKWLKKAEPSSSAQTFNSYLRLVYGYASTLSLEKELKKVSVNTGLEVGDVFIRGGSPGHCFIVVDVVKNTQGKSLFALVQGFMPSQNVHVVHHNGNIWFELGQDYSQDLPYGELISSKYLKRF
ncbi:MAG: hypothetical protein EAZ57_05965 [Cytophagales bacterium]|nr:MAG: hypothetical protein EAZ67_08155 [Cytophagales bacterium]TAF60730.1 MAG: hypothetical protein EAZ57_05965 [Cytophagales bacterium]